MDAITSGWLPLDSGFVLYQQSDTVNESGFEKSGHRIFVTYSVREEKISTLRCTEYPIYAMHCQQAMFLLCHCKVPALVHQLLGCEVMPQLFLPAGPEQ